MQLRFLSWWIYTKTFAWDELTSNVAIEGISIEGLPVRNYVIRHCELPTCMLMQL